MADRLAEDPALIFTRGGIYPWDDWTDGSVWRLVRGQDFIVPLDDMRANVYGEASRRGLKAKTTVRDGDLIIQFSAP